jgi:hypothetical protein
LTVPGVGGVSPRESVAAGVVDSAADSICAGFRVIAWTKYEYAATAPKAHRTAIALNRVTTDRVQRDLTPYA